MTDDCVCPASQTGCGDLDCPRATDAPARPRRRDLRPMPHGLKERVAAEIAARSAARLRVRQDTTTPEPTAETKEQTNG